MTKRAEYETDPSDRGRILVAGEWAREKHDLLADYIIATKNARKKFRRSTYTELFCGPGRVRYGKGGLLADGSALRAWKTSKDAGVPFAKVNIADLDAINVATCKARLEAAGAPVHDLTLPSHESGPRFLDSLGSGLHLVLLDPFGIDAMPFSLVEKFARYPKMDLMINYSVFDVQRNLLLNLRGERDNLEAFCPGWLAAIAGATNRRAQRGKLLAHWLAKIAACGPQYSGEMPLLRTGLNAPMYYLVFAANDEMPLRVWRDLARKRHRQPDLL